LTLQWAVDTLNSLDEDQLREALQKCSGSFAWCELMTRQRPFSDAEDLKEKSDRAWDQLSEQDWLDAFGSHPKIGDVESLRGKFAFTAAWASAEQASVYAATEETLKSLTESNARYEQRFGHIFIVFAPGKTADEMLSILNRRLSNSRDVEFSICSMEHKKITLFRIEKLHS